ncbi:pyridoxal phosphate-dependent aminotransferase [Prochlorococcus sp. MIT 1223]|uniref:pyridoxal phosphate-dependent aminotransferase n=1 Tax=Prochlorococcus sp. MIT 1223 TaxID=3096217 RepID=UPI002A7529A5|nr:pyridoxal phosphate-dependent aminotransferase [Prochlorococcus sp. MIT 1223]
MGLKPSLTLEITAKAKALRSQGKDVCSLSAGEPDFDTPDFIIEAAMAALKEGVTRYGPAGGDPELREAIANKMKLENKINYSSKNILVTNGGKQAIYNLFQVILNPGDEVLIPSPYWLSYPDIALLAGAKPIFIESSPLESFKIQIERLESRISEKTRLLILNSPSNPTGLVMSKKEMIAIAEFLRRHPKVLLMSDEIYEFLLAEGQVHYSFAAIAPDLLDRIFTVNGFAKAWAMTGWRIGYLAGNTEVIKKATALQSQSTSNVCSFAQKGALAAIRGPRESIKGMVEIYNYRRRLLSEGLERINGLTLTKPQGAFYAFPKVEKMNLTSIDFCKIALEEVGLSIIPGIAFGEDMCIRISCAVSEETISDGLARLQQLMTKFY